MIGFSGLLPPLNYGRGKLVGAGAGNCVAFGGGGHRPGSNANTTYGDVDVYCVHAKETPRVQ